MHDKNVTGLEPNAILMGLKPCDIFVMHLCVHDIFVSMFFGTVFQFGLPMLSPLLLAVMFSGAFTLEGSEGTLCSCTQANEFGAVLN